MVIFKAVFELIKGAKVEVMVDVTDAAQLCESSKELWIAAHDKAWGKLKEAMKVDRLAADLISLEMVAE